jgi:hypothetical protein
LKYRAEAIEECAVELNCTSAEMEINVQLAELADKPVSDSLQEAIRCGQLQLRKQMLPQLLKIKDLDELEETLKLLLHDQI